MHIQFNCQLVLKINSKESLTLIEMKATFYENDLGTDIAVGEIPEEYHRTS